MKKNGKRKSSKTRTSEKEFPRDEATEMLETLTGEVKALKKEFKNRYKEFQEKEEELKAEKKKTRQAKVAAQKERIKGKELLKLPQLRKLGIEDEIVRDHLESEGVRLEKLLHKRQQERRNTEANIQKMVELNKQSEAAVAGAQTMYNNSVVQHSKHQALLDSAELQLYAMESKVKHMRTMKTVEITTKDTFKKELRTIVREVQRRSDNEKLVRDVFRIAGKCLAADIGQDVDDDSSSDSSSSSSSSSVEISLTSSDDDSTG